MAKNIVVDLDGVICDEKQTFERCLAKPIYFAAESIIKLRKAGYRVLIYTARSWSEYEMTRAWLETNKIEYDELLMGKPVANIWIDDRAIRFTNWLDILKMLEINTIEDHELYVYRCGVKTYMEDICSSGKVHGPVLEIGPNDSSSNVFVRMPDTFIDVKSLVVGLNQEYFGCDIVDRPGIDIVADITTLSNVFVEPKFKTIICNSVIEHVRNIWDIPKELAHIMVSGGRLFMVSPWSIRLHGPRPDCWRISDDGFDVLFGQYFDIVLMNKLGGTDLDPVAFLIEMVKK